MYSGSERLYVMEQAVEPVLSSSGLHDQRESSVAISPSCISVRRSSFMNDHNTILFNLVKVVSGQRRGTLKL